MGIVIPFKTKEEIELEEAQAELRAAKEAKEYLSGNPIVDGEKLKRLIFAQAKVTRLQKLIRSKAN